MLIPDGDYVPPRVIVQTLHLSSGTLRGWGDTGKIRMIKIPSGHRYYHLQDIRDILGIITPPEEDPPIPNQKCCYARVSTPKQMIELERQQDMFRADFPDHELISDITSGTNWKRKGLQILLERSMSGHLKKLVIAHKDRLCRFAFDLLRFIFEKNGTQLRIVEETLYGSSEQELTDDIISIIHTYSGRENDKNVEFAEKKTRSDSAR